jgi:SP family general alpha glucoside:H+ symporter-like MFS transporter
MSWSLCPTQRKGDHKGIAAFPAVVMSLICFVWACFRLPETKNRTYAELDILFELEVPARKFKDFAVQSLDMYS